MSESSNTPKTSEATSSDSQEKANKSPKVQGVDQLAELEKRSAAIADKIREKNAELKDLTARQRQTDAKIRELKEKQLSDFLKSSGIGEFSPKAWRAAEAEIKALLERSAGVK